ncbi:hypothetical protein HYY69_08045 [Candidatus Woesearchaeota archaeon]|nr:hypothetical protein [Candidatus Woesearchaeota archaeon]
MNEIEYFVEVDQKKELRNELLTLSKAFVELLQRSEKIRQLQIKRKLEIETIKERIKEIAKLTVKLRTALPSIKLANIEEEKEDIRYTQQLEALEESIHDIEKKLKNIEPVKLKEINVIK